ncbi:hypothetical protein [Pseudoalteromonas rubra]|uniref:hypothetical protein n=1 Tax=Pseudoalteromonas rubra TaxID=43658 RepID=UPI000F79F37A|nr:hypothetical protein [Pseudoalteromonas rubra]
MLKMLCQSGLMALTLLSATVTQAQTSAHVKSLSVQGTTATFSLVQDKTHTLPACVNPDTRQLWSLDITSIQGRALYSLLMTAVSKSQLVSVQSANNCDVLAGIEQVAGLTTEFDHSAPQVVSDGGLVLYQGNGITKLGKVSDITGNTVSYINHSGWISYFYRHVRGDELMFTDERCATEPYGNRNAFFTTGERTTFSLVAERYLVQKQVNGNVVQLNKQAGPFYSYGFKNGVLECTNMNKQNWEIPGDIYLLETVEHPLCGNRVCVIK